MRIAIVGLKLGWANAGISTHNHTRRATNPYINWPDIAKYEFPLPPLDKQKHIAKVLWAADESVRKYTKSLEKLKIVKSHILKLSFQHESAVKVACGDLYNIPPRNGFSPKTNAFKKGCPTLSISAIRDGKVSPTGNTKYAEISLSDLEKFRLKPGNILVVRGNGNKSLCGKAGLVLDVPKDCFYPDLLIRISFDEDKILPDYAVEQWNDSGIHNRLMSLAKSTNGIWKINGKDLRQHKLHVPDLDVQKEIVSKISDLSVREDALSDQIRIILDVQRQVANNLTKGFVNG